LDFLDLAAELVDFVNQNRTWPPSWGHITRAGSARNRSGGLCSVKESSQGTI